MGFGQDWNDMVAAYATTSKAAKGTKAAKTVEDQSFKEKSALLREIYKEEAQYVRDQDRAKLEAFKRDMEVRAKAVSAQQALTRTLIESGTKLTTAQLAANAQLAKQWQADMTKLATSYDSRGARWLTNETARAYIGDPSLRGDAGELSKVITSVIQDSWDVEDPSSLGLFDALARQFGTPEMTARLPELAGAAERQRKQREAAAAAAEKFQTLKVPPGGLTQEAVDEMTMTLGSVSLAKPSKVKDTTEEELAADTHYQALESRRKQLEGEGGGVASASSSSWGGLGEEGASNILSDPKFRRWAKDHGYSDLGEVTDSGAFRFGKDSWKALSAATAELSGKGKGDKGLEPVEVTTGHTPPDRFMFVWNPDGSLAAYVYASDGSIRRTDFKDPSKDVLVRGPTDEPGVPGKVDEAAKSEMLREVGTDATPSAVGVRGGPPLTAAKIAESVQAGTFDQATLTHKEEELEQVTDAKTVRGARLAARIGDDPDLTMRVVQDNGKVVSLHRQTDKSPWEVVDGEVTPEKVEMAKTKVRPKSRVLDAWDVLTGKLPKEEAQAADVEERDARNVGVTPVTPEPLPPKAGQAPDRIVNPFVKPAEASTPVRIPAKASPAADVPTLEDFTWGGRGSVTMEEGTPQAAEAVAPRSPSAPSKVSKLAPKEELTAEDLGLTPMGDGRGRLRTEYMPAAADAAHGRAEDAKASARDLTAAFSDEAEAQADRAESESLAAKAKSLEQKGSLPPDIQETLDTPASGETGSKKAATMDALRKARELARLRQQAQTENMR